MFPLGFNDAGEIVYLTLDAKKRFEFAFCSQKPYGPLSKIHAIDDGELKTVNSQGIEAFLVRLKKYQDRRRDFSEVFKLIENKNKAWSR